jgi:hypothetical protein
MGSRKKREIKENNIDCEIVMTILVKTKTEVNLTSFKVYNGQEDKINDIIKNHIQWYLQWD